MARCRGRLSGWLDLGGTPRAPRKLQGQLSLRKGRLRWTRPRLAEWLDADDAQMDLRLTGPATRLHLDKLSAERPGGVGTVSVTGLVDWPDTTAPPSLLDLAVQEKMSGCSTTPMRAPGEALI